MIIKFSKIISCTSQHQNYPVKNLLEYRSSPDSSTWLCAKPGALESEVIFELAEPASVIGVDIGNARCCSVRIAGSTIAEPDDWVTIVEHEFMSRNDAEDGHFKDQVQLFTKKEIKEETTKIVFARVKVTCSQPANLKVLFGLSFLTLRTEDKKDTGNLDAFGRFKMKHNTEDSVDTFKERLLQHIRPKPRNFKTELVKDIEKKRAISIDQKSDEPVTRKRPSLNLTRSSPEPETSNNGAKQGEKPEGAEESNERPVKRAKITETDVVQSNSGPQKTRSDSGRPTTLENSKKESEKALSKDVRGRARCSLCLGNEENVLCKTCSLLKPEKETEGVGKRTPKQRAVKPVKKPAKEFTRLFEGVTFSLSGYKNPERDEIRRKALRMGAKYCADTSRRNHGCTHLVCAFKNTPKYNELKGSAKIVSHRWVEECFEKKTKFSWRRYALDSDDRNEPESEEEITGSSGPPTPPSIYDQDTDSDH